jgi:hypothetical protein
MLAQKFASRSLLLEVERRSPRLRHGGHSTADTEKSMVYERMDTPGTSGPIEVEVLRQKRDEARQGHLSRKFQSSPVSNTISP